MGEITYTELDALAKAYHAARNHVHESKWDHQAAIVAWWMVYTKALVGQYGDQLAGTISPIEHATILKAAVQAHGNQSLGAIDHLAGVMYEAIQTDPPAPEPDWKLSLHPGDKIDGLAKPGDPMPECYARALDKAGPEYIDVFLPQGRIEGAKWGDDGWAYNSQIDMAAAGKRVVRVFGHPGGTTVIPQEGDASMVLASKGWEGRIRFFDLRIEGSPGSNVGGGTYGKSFKDPMEDVRFVRTSFVDGPKPTTRPCSLNQMQVQFHECEWHMPLSLEHACYLRNGFGTSGMWNCIVSAVGGQVWQEVQRPHEGPQYDPGTTVIRDSLFFDYHQDFSRMGTALTFAGSGRHGHIEGVRMYDLAADPDRAYSAGALVVWNGGWDNYYPLPSGAACGRYFVRDFVAVQRNGNRAPISVQNCERFELVDSAAYSPRSVDVLNKCLELVVSGCNQPHHREAALAMGVEESDLVEPDVRFPDQGKTLGKLAQFAWDGPVA